MTDQPQYEQMPEPKKLKRQRKPKGRGNGEGSVFKRSGERTKPWVAQITLENGKPTVIGYFKTETEAIAAKNKALRELEQNVWVANSRQALGEYLNYWLEDVHRSSLKVTTYVTYRRVLDLHLIPSLGHIQIQKLTVHHLQLFYSDLLQTLKAGRIRYIHAVLHTALNHAIKEGLITRNISQSVQLPRRKQPDLQVLTLEQAAQLIEATSEDRFKMLLTLAITTGMRQGEILGLKWQDIDWEKQQLQVRRSIARLKGQGIVEIEPKTTHSRRKIALPLFVMELLKEYKTRQEGIRLQAGDLWQNNDLVFCVWHGGHIHPSFLDRVFQRFLKTAGLAHIRFHDLRHSAVTILLEMGVPAQVVQEIAGHSNISTTLGIYGHVLPGQQAKAVNHWDGRLGSAKSSESCERLRLQWQGYSPATKACLERLLKLYGEDAARLALEAIKGL